jgi:signal transduction histidine kinase
MELEEGLPKMTFDRDRVIQVLTNLTSNAINNTEKGSVTLTVRKKNDVVHLSVRDTGAGIPAEDIPKLFQPFEQVVGVPTKKKGGTGLGLVISKEIVLAHHGKIWAESEVGKGSTFHLVLPIQERRGLS